MKRSLLLALIGIFTVAGMASAQDYRNTSYNRNDNANENRREYREERRENRREYRDDNYRNDRNDRGYVDQNRGYNNPNYGDNENRGRIDDRRDIERRGGFGIRGGLNIATVTNLNSKAGFNLGGSYEIMLTRRFPLYFETGLYLQYKGGKETVDGYTNEVNLWYLEIPALLSYHVQIGRNWTVQPYFGLYYALGVGGKYKSLGESSDVFGNYFNRSDFGIRVGAGATWKQLYFGVGYDAGLINISKDKVKPQLGSVKTGSFYITIGYNF
ncbi:outer membrane beta-barrel protein [Alistipes sp.]|jgi:hypothetical protein|uniref:outer membrane beta-barrel protein n=1 Tax=Alistipes sp. TaxID=1872444 RepID=UPI0011CBD655|nr:outer membrane beta-barrel protein [Alistipes sp.]MBS6100653.1 outer membrane beta-barrel protein [Alistipes sp.]HJI20079.1 porin family protein [Rikenellaceae bacterium]